MIYSILNDIVISSDQFRTITFNKETVALSYSVLIKEPAKKYMKLALNVVSRYDGSVIYTFATREFTGEDYTVVNNIFDINGDLTPEGYEYALDNFYIDGITPLRDVIDGPVDFLETSSEV